MLKRVLWACTGHEGPVEGDAKPVQRCLRTGGVDGARAQCCVVRSVQRLACDEVGDSDVEGEQEANRGLRRPVVERVGQKACETARRRHRSGWVTVCYRCMHGQDGTDASVG